MRLRDVCSNTVIPADETGPAKRQSRPRSHSESLGLKAPTRDPPAPSGVFSFIPDSQLLELLDPVTHTWEPRRPRDPPSVCLPATGIETSSPRGSPRASLSSASVPQDPPRRPARVQGRGCCLGWSHLRPGRWPLRSAAGTSYTAPPPRGTSLWARCPPGLWQLHGGERPSQPSHPRPAQGRGPSVPSSRSDPAAFGALASSPRRGGPCAVARGHSEALPRPHV